MLDRKTKNIDASVELLKDRKKGNEIWCAFALIFATCNIIFGVLLEIHTFSIMGIAMLICGLAYVMFNIEYKLLIQSRNIMNMQQGHTLLLNEILNNMDSLERKVKKKKVEKR